MNEKAKVMELDEPFVDALEALLRVAFREGWLASEHMGGALNTDECWADAIVRTGLRDPNDPFRVAVKTAMLRVVKAESPASSAAPPPERARHTPAEDSDVVIARMVVANREARLRLEKAAPELLAAARIATAGETATATWPGLEELKAAILKAEGV